MWITIPYSKYKVKEIPKLSGIYRFHVVRKRKPVELYIGKGKSLNGRLQSHSSFIKRLYFDYGSQFCVSYFLGNDISKMEKSAIYEFKPKHNVHYNTSHKSTPNCPILAQVISAMDGRVKIWLAKKIGIREAELSKKMNGHIQFSEDELLKIELVLDFKIKRNFTPQ